MQKNTLLAVIISGAICIVIGFGSGALLTKPNREKIKSAVAAVEAKAEEERTILQQEIMTAKQEITIAKDEISAAKSEIARRADETVNLKQAIERLGNELKLITAERDELVIEKFKPRTFVHDKDTLKGLQGVGVVVEEIPPGTETSGLTKQQLQTDVELQLRQNGIKVLGNEQYKNAWLYINVNFIMNENSGLVTYSISITCQQDSLLVRDPTKECSASTWNSGSVGLCGVSKIGTIREKVKDQVNSFINDYLAVNPK